MLHHSRSFMNDRNQLFLRCLGRKYFAQALKCKKRYNHCICDCILFVFVIYEINISYMRPSDSSFLSADICTVMLCLCLYAWCHIWTIDSAGPADLVFDPTLAFIRFPEDLLLRYAMITARSPAHGLRGSFCPHLAWTCNHRPGTAPFILPFWRKSFKSFFSFFT